MTLITVAISSFGFIIPVAIWGFIIFKIIKVSIRNSKTNQKDTANSRQFVNSRQSVSNYPTHAQLKQHIPTHTVKASFDRDAMEDRDNDWLAQQLLYEQRVQGVLSDMFMLKQEHTSHCDALEVQYPQRQTKMTQEQMDALKNEIRNRTIVQ